MLGAVLDLLLVKVERFLIGLLVVAASGIRRQLYISRLVLGDHVFKHGEIDLLKVSNGGSIDACMRLESQGVEQVPLALERGVLGLVDFWNYVVLILNKNG